VAKAVEMCADGNPIKAKEALALGIVDKLIDGDLLTGAVAFAREIAGKPARKTRDRNEKLGSAEQNAPIFAAARDAAGK
jgi:enoyl-CoA hydratase/carnithine racemase